MSNNEEEALTKKDPHRVEAGKRLAPISKAAKEKKMRDRIEAELRKGALFTDLLPLSYTFYISVATVSSIFFLGIYKLITAKEVSRETPIENNEEEEEEPKMEKKKLKQVRFETLG